MNAVIYARYSSHNQTEQSIEGQLRDCYEYAKKHEITIVSEYIDRAISGTTDEREAFQKMIADASKRQFQRILVWKLDRFARNRYDSAMYKHKLKQYGVKVISVMENVGEGDESILLEALLEASAEYYSLDLKKKIRRGMRESAIKGVYMGGNIPYGFFVDPTTRKLCVQEEEAAVLRWIFKEYAAGTGAAKLADECARKGIRNKKGSLINVVSISRMLKNRKYIGEYMYDGQPVEGGCPAIIDTETFAAANKRMTQNKRIGGGQATAKVDYLLSGKMYCGLCGAPIIAESGKSKTGQKYHYYTCSKRKKTHTCPKANERKDFIEWYVCEQTLEYILTSERMDYIAEAIISQNEKEFDRSEIKSLEVRIANIESEIQNALTMCLRSNNETMQNRLMARMEELDAQKAEHSANLSRLRIAADIQYKKEDIVSWLATFCRGDLMDMAFRERMIDTFINSVILYDDRIIIYYNIKDGMQASYIGTVDEHAEIIIPENEKDKRCSTACPHGGANVETVEHFYIISKHFFGLCVQIRRETA